MSHRLRLGVHAGWLCLAVATSACDDNFVPDWRLPYADADLAAPGLEAGAPEQDAGMMEPADAGHTAPDAALLAVCFIQGCDAGESCNGGCQVPCRLLCEGTGACQGEGVCPVSCASCLTVESDAGPPPLAL